MGQTLSKKHCSSETKQFDFRGVLRSRNAFSLGSESEINNKPNSSQQQQQTAFNFDNRIRINEPQWKANFLKDEPV